MNEKDLLEEISFEWLDSDTFVTSNDGQLVPAGTVIRLMNQIIFLSPLSEGDLTKLKEAVSHAVDHELNKRKG